MSSPVTMSPEEMIFSFKQGSEENFKEAWSRINNSYDKTEPKMTLGLLLSSFYFGLVLCYRYALDIVVGGDFFHCDGDRAFNAIKKLIATYSSPSKFDSSLVSIYSRLNTLETSTTCLKECYNLLHENYDYVSINYKPSSWLPTVKVDINGETFHARCDIMSDFCVMLKYIYESLNLWELYVGEEEISLTNNVIILPIGVDEGVYRRILGRNVYKNLGRMLSTDYLVNECVEKGQITLGRSLLKLLGAKKDVGERHHDSHFLTRWSSFFP